MSIKQGNNIIAGSTISVIEKQDPTAQNNYTWYRKYNDGWVEQGGTPTTSTTITFPIPMQDSNYWFICRYINSSANSPIFSNFGYSRTTTGFTYNNASSPGTTTFVWYICGKAA